MEKLGSMSSFIDKKEPDVLLSAAEARKRTETVIETENAEILKNIAEKINEAIANKEFTVNIQGELNSYVIKKLEEKEYNVQFYPGNDFRDPTSEYKPHYLISWN